MTDIQFPKLKHGSDAWHAARDGMVEIIKGWASEGRTGSYGTLSESLRDAGFSVPPRGTLMSNLLEAACRVEADRGVPVMLTAIVVNKKSRRPSGQFEVLAKTAPFRRGDEPGWGWETERDRVFVHYGPAVRHPSSSTTSEA